MTNYNKRYKASLDNLRDVNPDSDYYRADSLKAHITSKITNPTINSWTNFTGFELVYRDLITDYLQLDTDSKTFEIQRNGLYQFGGCIHIQNNTTGNISVTILTRVWVNGNDEARCSQRGMVTEINSGEEYTVTYNGNQYFYKGDTLTLQYYTDNSDLDFYSNSNFQEQVAATLWMHYIGGKVK